MILGRRRREERALRWVTTQPRRVRTARCVCSEGGRLSTLRGEKRAGHAPQVPTTKITTRQSRCRRPFAVLVRWIPGRPRGEERDLHLPQHNNAKSALRGARAPWAVGRCSMRRKGRGPRATGSERGGLYLLTRVRSTCHGDDALEPWPTALGEACPKIGHNTTMPSPHCAARVLCGRPVGTLFGAKSARAARRWTRSRESLFVSVGAPDLSRCWCGRAPAGGVGRSASYVGPIECGVYNCSNFVLPTCRGVGSVEPRPTAWGRANHALDHNTTTPNLHCVVRVLYGRSTGALFGTKSARAARRRIRKRESLLASVGVVNLSRCWCGRTPANGMGRSAHHVWRQHTHFKSTLRGARALWAAGWGTLRGEKRASRAPLDPKSSIAVRLSPCRRPIAVLVRSSSGRRRWKERVLRWTN